MGLYIDTTLWQYIHTIILCMKRRFVFIINNNIHKRVKYANGQFRHFDQQLAPGILLKTAANGQFACPFSSQSGLAGAEYSLQYLPSVLCAVIPRCHSSLVVKELNDLDELDSVTYRYWWLVKWPIYLMHDMMMFCSMWSGNPRD